MKIGTVANMTGLSTSGIRYLEKQGLLSPSGGRKGTYRSYTLADVSTILDYRNYRKCGFTQEEIIQLFSENNLDDAIFDQHCDDLERQLQDTMRLLHFLRHRSRDIANIRRMDSFWEIIQRPAIIFQPLQTESGISEEWPEDTGFELPYVDSVLMFNTSAIPDATSPLPATLGIGMMESDIMNSSFLNQKDIKYFGAHLAFHCIVEITDDFTIPEESLMRLNMNLSRLAPSYEPIMSRPAISKRIMTARTGSGPCRYDHLWIDVERTIVGNA